MQTVAIRLPVLTRLVLGEIAERRGQDEATLLAEMIRKEAVAELGMPTGQVAVQAGHAPA